MTRESVIENYLIRKVKALGGQLRKVRWIGRNGAPDRLVLMEGDHAFVELKRPKKKAEAHQAREHAILRWAGFKVYVCDTQEEVDEVLNGKR